MLSILIYWCFLFLITSAFGIVVCKIFNFSDTPNPTIILLFGGFGITVIASIVAIFGNLGVYFEVALIILSIFIILIYRRLLNNIFLSLKAKIATLAISLKIIFIAILILALAQSATAPYMIDNETYYIQTVKWLDNFGFVPGLANLHFFLSQMSGFHILQAATNLDGVFHYFNDLSGFYLVVGNLYALFHIQRYFESKELPNLIIGLFPIFNVFLFQFIGAPSPDILIYVLSLVIFGEYLKNYNEADYKTIVLLFILTVFATYTKLTAILLVVLPLQLALKKQSLKKLFIPLSLTGVLMLLLFLIKNSIITGHPFYPLVLESTTIARWALPENLQQFFSEQTKLHGYFLQATEYNQASTRELFTRWLFLPKLHGLFNFGMIILLTIMPFLIRKNPIRNSLFFIYGLAVLQMVLLWVSSPQYRYFFMFFMILLCICIASLKLKKNILIIGLGSATILIAIPLFVPFNLNSLTTNEFHMSLSTFSSDYSFLPHSKTKYTDAKYEPFTIGKDTLYTPTNIEFFWATGDGPLPCVQRDQVLYFAQEYKIIPQRRGSSLKDGFFSKEITNE
ncbi:hypothetical protein EAX61_08140 [Dokdonia sinensis]|uniref:DUF8201 domain-containing protein n=1 Tax=Dokdonia sinensis TaxID=2479847 RepID=A0A3M0G3M9_9FLAO|nr:hypothetical protein [Dokdonia sinensis]RMB59544.1 hypothetical protein EAX61_08140 [Dokdonia sinensis]